MTKIKKCPFCAEEILEEAIKCKHCKEFLDHEPVNELNSENGEGFEEDTEIDKEETNFNFLDRIIFPILIFLFGYGLFFFGGWQIVWGEKINLLKQMLLTGNLHLKEQSLLFLETGFVIRINELYYGFAVSSRFFDSPFIQWIMLFPSLYLMLRGVFYLIFGGLNED